MTAGVLRQRPSTQTELPRRERSQGFSPTPIAETISLSDPVTVERSRPLHFSIQDGVADPVSEHGKRFAERSDNYLAGPLLLSRLPGALVDTSRFVICPSEQRYLLDSFRHPRGLIRWGYTHVEEDVYERELSEPIEERSERVVVLGAQANRNYSHWLVESVIRALLFKPFDDGSILYLCPRLEDWQREALVLAGVPAERILTIPRRRLVRFPEVLAVSRGMSRIPELIPDAVSKLAELVRSIPHGDRGADIPACPRRLFVSRSLVKQRHMSNEAELLPVLARHGFETVHPQTLSLSEQIELFANAEVVVGSWGSGLTNLIFSPPGTIVLELQPEDVDFGGNAFVWNLASIRGQRFAQVVCPITAGMRHLPLGERDMTVDVREIDALLGQLLPA
jgi:Glycosyltransferase 61